MTAAVVGVPEKKAQLRRAALASRRAIPAEQIGRLSEMVEKNLSGLTEYRDARTIASYVAMSDEVQTMPILRGVLAQGKALAAPVVDATSGRLLFVRVRALDELTPGYKGCLEPSPLGEPIRLSEVDLALVPLVAWDPRGYRLGYGRGYFDRALADRGGCLAVGLGFESQRVPRIPETAADVKLDALVTEERVVWFREPEASAASRAKTDGRRAFITRIKGEEEDDDLR